MPEVFGVIMRWLHISSVATLVGGMLYARLVALPVCPEGLAGQMALRYRHFVHVAIICLALSGVYNIVSTPGHTPRYYILLGAKLLLVLHVFAVALLAVQPEAPRRARLMTGLIASGLVIIAISAYLHRTF